MLMVASAGGPTKMAPVVTAACGFAGGVVAGAVVAGFAGGVVAGAAGGGVAGVGSAAIAAPDQARMPQSVRVERAVGGVRGVVLMA